MADLKLAVPLSMGDGVPSADKASWKDYASDQVVRWCPGCGDYAILKSVQRVLAEKGIRRSDIAFISGIGCSSRFRYYMDTYGFHTIHGRAPAFATGLRVARPDLDVWVVTGDGDALSIGGNHLLHVLRRNVSLKILLFNNQIYGLTKGQYSPTSEIGKVTASTPWGSVDKPLNPVSVAAGAEAAFIARTVDIYAKHLQQVLIAAHGFEGSSFIEIWQNCNIFNDKTFDDRTEKSVKDDRILFLEHGQPMIFGKESDRGIKMDGATPTVVSLSNGAATSDLLVHDMHDPNPSLAFMLSRFDDHPDLPSPMGIFRSVARPTYEHGVALQMLDADSTEGAGELDSLLRAGDVWEVE